jgi:hypothetical protein
MTEPNTQEAKFLREAARALDEAQYRLSCANIACSPNSENPPLITRWRETLNQVNRQILQLVPDPQTYPNPL